MQESQQLCLQFHEKFECYSSPTPTWPPYAVRSLRYVLMAEELVEFQDAAFRWYAGGESLVAVADALADLQYVLDGTALAFGLDLQTLVREVHRSNMSKVWPDGAVHKREDGKVIKPPTYSPADLAPILQSQLPLYPQAPTACCAACGRSF